MHSKILAVLFLSATALAAAELERKEYDYSNYLNDDYYSSLMSDLDSLATNTDYKDYMTALDDLPTGYSKYLTSSPTADSGSSESDKTSITAGPTLPSFDLPPASIQSVLATAIPESYLSQLANPSAASSIYNEIQHGHFPGWYKSLPASVKDWLSTHYADATAAATGASATNESGPGSGSQGKGDVPGAAPPSGVVATGLMGAACILAVAVML